MLFVHVIVIAIVAGVIDSLRVIGISVIIVSVIIGSDADWCCYWYC